MKSIYDLGMIIIIVNNNYKNTTNNIDIDVNISILQFSMY